jgi:LuxR family maltose regulon positive regulatory protein
VERDWGAAEAVLEPILAEHARLKLPMIYCDPRISLAYAKLRAGKAAAAWQTFEPVFAETTQRFGMGLLLLDSRAHVAELLDAAPVAVRGSSSMQHLRGVLQQWNVVSAPAAARSTDSVAGPLSEREREVLDMVASGASNKHIARSLDLSLHTVKRHICNILDKLDCDSRGQAADLYRRSARA